MRWYDRVFDRVLDEFRRTTPEGDKPAKLFVPLHHQELGHLGGRWRCVGFEDEPLKIVRSLRADGFNAAMPVWGDRIV